MKLRHALRESQRDRERHHQVHDLSATKPDDAGNGHGGENFDDRVVDGVRQDGVFVGFAMAVVDFGEFVVGAALAIEELEHRHATDVFLQVRVNPGDSGADAAVGISHLDAENLRGVGDERKHSKGDERQLPIHCRHNENNSDQHKDVFENRNNARGEHLVEGVDVGGDARDQAADRILVVEADVHVLQVAEDLAAKVEHDFLSDPLHEIGLGELQNKAERDDAGVNSRKLCDAGERLGAEKPVEEPGRLMGLD